MNVSVELSMYPLQDDFLARIKTFLAQLRKHRGITIKTNSMSTRIYGEYEVVMDVLKEEIALASAEDPHVVFVMKIIPIDLNTD